MNSTEFFKKNNYVVIRNFLPEYFANLYYSYTIKRCLFLNEKMGSILKEHYNKELDGFRGDEETGYSSYNFYVCNNRYEHVSKRYLSRLHQRG